MSGDTCTTHASLQSAVSQGGLPSAQRRHAQVLAPAAHIRLGAVAESWNDLEIDTYGRRRPISPPSVRSTPPPTRLGRHRVPSAALSSARLPLRSMVASPAGSTIAPEVETVRADDSRPFRSFFMTSPRRRLALEFTSSGSRPDQAWKGSRRQGLHRDSVTTCSCFDPSSQHRERDDDDSWPEGQHLGSQLTDPSMPRCWTTPACITA
jgi:hypothetical protein